MPWQMYVVETFDKFYWANSRGVNHTLLIGNNGCHRNVDSDQSLLTVNAYTMASI